MRYDEVMRGEIPHAIRVTFEFTRKAYVKPATHYASAYADDYLPAMGHRFRLSSEFNCSTLAFSAKVICVALQRYGCIVADNGANWFLSGEQHPNWNVQELEGIKTIPATLMELVDTGDELCVTPECFPIPPAREFPKRSAYPDLTSLHMEGNVYWKDTAYTTRTSVEFVDRDPTNFWRAELSETLEPWSTHANTDATSTIGNPKLSAGFHILGNESAAFWSSRAAPGLATDFDFFGNPRRVSSDFMVDAGAVAYGNAGSIVRPLSAETLAQKADVANSGFLPPDPQALFVDPCAAYADNAPTLVYVSTGSTASDNSCTGTLERPFRTVGKGLSVVAPGGTVFLMRALHTLDASVILGKNGVKLTGDTSHAQRTILRLSHFSGADTVVVLADSVTLSYLEIVGGTMSALRISGRSATVENCTLHGSGSAVVTVERTAANARLAGNVIRNGGQRNPRRGDGVLVRGAAWPTLVGNSIFSIRSTAIHLREGSRYAHIEGNVMADVRRGISLGNDNANNKALPTWEDYAPDVDNVCDWTPAAATGPCFAVQHAFVANNVVLNAEGFGLGFAGCDNISAIGNTLRRVATSDLGAIYFTAVQHYRSATNAPVSSNTNILVANTIVTLRPTSFRPAVFIRRAQDWSSNAYTGGIASTSTVLRNNMYFKEPFAAGKSFATEKAPDRFYTRNANPIADATKVFFESQSYVSSQQASLELWQQRGFDAGSSATLDPLFAGIAPCLQTTGSPALGAAATDLAANLDLPVDTLGVARGATPDLGALQSDAGCVASLTSPSGRFRGIPLVILDSPQANPLSCIPPTINSTRKTCDGVDCYHPWMRQAAPAGLNLSTLLNAQCTNFGSMFPANHAINRDISQSPVHPMSEAYVTSIPGAKIHPDMGTLYSGVPMGISYMLVRGSKMPKDVRVQFRYSSESDDVFYPIPEGSPVEGGDCDAIGDRHILALDVETCTVYEIFKVAYLDEEYRGWLGVSMVADSGAVFKLGSNEFRKLGYTSADAAGLSVFAGLVFHDEILNGAIKHAIRFTVKKSQKAYFFPPATHFASNDRNAFLPPMGIKIRLKSWYNCTSAANNPKHLREFTIVCTAMKKYGLILADNGGDWFINGASDARSSDEGISTIYGIPTSAMEVVNIGGKLCTTSSCT